MPSKVKFDSPCIAFAPVTVTIVLFVDPVKLGPAPVNPLPSPTNDVAVITPAFPIFILLPTSNCPPLTFTPDLAVIIPIASTFVTSS